MAEILAALLYCNLQTNELGKYSLKFAPGRLVAGITRLGVIGFLGYLYLHG